MSFASFAAGYLALSGLLVILTMSLAPKPINFEGFVNYGSPITTMVTGPDGNPMRVHIHN